MQLVARFNQEATWGGELNVLIALLENQTLLIFKFHTFSIDFYIFFSCYLLWKNPEGIY